MQPPISTRSPATSIMTYSELDSKHLTVPRATSGETSAAQTTAPRSFHTFTRSRCRMPRSRASKSFIRATQK
jgi:hypothetical protein